jgi:rhodanese-related sulfurtransferase
VSHPRHWLIAAGRDSAIVVVVAAAVALSVNQVRSARLPLVAREPYNVLVPCPDTVGSAAPLAPTVLALRGDLVIDARVPADYAAWHVPGARSIPFDYLEPTAPAQVQAVARSGARRVVVYGDGQTPDSGQELARELAGRGLRSVFFVQGGAAALRALTPGTRP